MILYSDSVPKRPDITGSTDQAYSLTSMFEAVVKAIGANLIAGLMGVQHSGELCHLFCLKIHYDTAGDPIAIIGNLSNTIGNFQCAQITKRGFSLFTAVGETSGAPPTHGDAIDAAIISKSSFDQSNEYVAYLMPCYVLIYWGMGVFYGNIIDDDLKLKISSLGQGYRAWVKAAAASIENEDDIEIVLAETKSKNRGTINMQALYGMKWDKKSGMPINTGTAAVHVSLIQNVSYPAETGALQQIFCPPSIANAAFPGALVSPSGNITFTLADDKDKESEAAKGATKLTNLLLKGVVDFESCTVSALESVKTSIGFQIVMDTPRSGRAIAFQDLAKEVMVKTKNADPTSLKSRDMTMKTISRAASVNLISGNFATDHAGSQNNESTSVDLSLFLPQNEISLVKESDAFDLQTRTENNMDMADSHKSKLSTSIKRLGTLKTSDDFRRVLVNMLILFTAISDGSSPLPILQQVILNLFAFVTTSEWEEWIQKCGDQMPNLQFDLYSSLEKIFLNHCKAATLFTNVNVVIGKRPLTDLDILPIIQSLQLLKNFKEHYTRHIISTTPMQVSSSIATRYKNLITSPQPVSLLTQPVTSENTQSNTASRSRAADPAPEVEGDNVSNQRSASPTKKGRGKADAVRDRTKFGVFYLKDPAAKGQIFPSTMEQKLCAYYTCKGRQCTTENCTFVHPKNNGEITNTTWKQVCAHFEKTKLGWINEWPVSQGNLKNFPDEYKHLLGGASGPTNTSKSS